MTMDNKFTCRKDQLIKQGERVNEKSQQNSITKQINNRSVQCFLNNELNAWRQPIPQLQMKILFSKIENIGIWWAAIECGLLLLLFSFSHFSIASKNYLCHLEFNYFITIKTMTRTIECKRMYFNCSFHRSQQVLCHLEYTDTWFYMNFLFQLNLISPNLHSVMDFLIFNILFSTISFSLYHSSSWTSE